MTKLHQLIKKLIKQYNDDTPRKTKIRLAQDLEVSYVLFQNLLDPKYAKRIQPTKEKNVPLYH